MHYSQENMRGQRRRLLFLFEVENYLDFLSTSRIRREAQSKFMYDTYMTGYAVFDLSLNCDNKYLTVRSNYLIIRLRARVLYEQIVNETQPSRLSR